MVSELCFGKATQRSHRTRRKAWASTKTRPQRGPFNTGKHSGRAAPNGSKTDPKRSRLGAENGASESGKKKHWESFGNATDQGQRARGQARADSGMICKSLAMGSSGKYLAVAHPSQAPAPAWHGVDIPAQTHA